VGLVGYAGWRWKLCPSPFSSIIHVRNMSIRHQRILSRGHQKMRATELLIVTFGWAFVFGANMSDAAEWITKDHCDLTIAFPDNPRVSSLSTFGMQGTSYEYSHSEILRAEFLFFPDKLSERGAAEYEEILSNYAIGNGFQNWYVSQHLGEELPHAFVRGNKVIEGKQVIYKSTLYLREQCALIVMVATLASMYPTDWIIDFERSVHIR